MSEHERRAEDAAIHRLDLGGSRAEPCSIVIFGASGDLTARKLIPALYHLLCDNQMPEAFRVVGVARREKTDDSFREELKHGVETFSRTRAVDPERWAAFSRDVSYCRGDLSDPATYKKLKARLDEADDEAVRRNLLFYLAISPTQFAEVVRHLDDARLLGKNRPGEPWRRIVVEKPFGQNLASARELNDELTRYANENQIFRIDHYLGKETVQNILIFRFSNLIFEQLWSRDSVDHVQITVSENLGVGERGGYYEHAGALRDMVQNHLLQVMALVAMEPPGSLEAESIRDEKVKLLKCIAPLTPERVAAHIVRGQ